MKKTVLSFVLAFFLIGIAYMEGANSAELSKTAFDSAQGLTELYSSPGDMYYHQYPSCMGRNDLNVIFDANGLYPCPVCTDDPVTHGQPEALALGNIVLMRIPDQWMCSRPDIGPIFASDELSVYADSEAEHFIAKRLHGTDYRGFLNSSGVAAYTYDPGLYGTNDYSCRHIGDSWYLAMYLPITEDDDKPDDESNTPWRTEDYWYGYLRFFGGRIWKHDGLTFFNHSDEWGDRHYSTPLSRIQDQAEFETDQDGHHISLYTHEDIHLCVINNVLGNREYGMTAILDELPICSNLWAYDGVCCFTVTTAEADRLKSGGEIRLFDGEYEAVDFGKSEFAVFNSNSYWWNGNYTGVVDKHGNEVLSERFYRVSRIGDVFFCTLSEDSGSDAPDGLYVYDLGKSDKPLFQYTEPASYIYLETANDSIFILQWFGEEDKYVLCDMQTGEKLCDLFNGYTYPYGFSVTFNAEYVYTSGVSERICCITNDVAYLMDNNAGEIAQFRDCDQLIPLVWNDSSGLYLVVFGKDARNLPRQKALYKNGFDAGYYTDHFEIDDDNDSWSQGEMPVAFDLNDEDDSYDFEKPEPEIADIHFGLINEQGDYVTETDFTYIHVLSTKQVELGKRDGTRIIVDS